MNFKKTIPALCLVATLAATPAFAFNVETDVMQGDMVYQGQEGQQVQVSPKYAKQRGTVVTQEGQLVFTSVEGVESNLVLTQDALVIDAATRLPLNVEDLADNTYVELYVSPMQTLQYPAVLNTYYVVANPPMDAGVPQIYVVYDIEKTEDGIVVISDTNERISIPNDTSVLPYLTKNMVTVADIQLDSELLVEYSNAMNGEASVYGITILPAKMVYDGSVTLGEDVTYRNDQGETLVAEVMMEQDGQRYVGLREAAEFFGYTVNWVSGGTVTMEKSDVHNAVNVYDNTATGITPAFQAIFQVDTTYIHQDDIANFFVM